MEGKELTPEWLISKHGEYSKKAVSDFSRRNTNSSWYKLGRADTYLELLKILYPERYQEYVRRKENF